MKFIQGHCVHMRKVHFEFQNVLTISYYCTAHNTTSILSTPTEFLMSKVHDFTVGLAQAVRVTKTSKKLVRQLTQVKACPEARFI